MSGWIGVDLDRTLARYDGWGDGSIGEPIPAMVDRVKHWLKEGKEVKIVTARVNRGGDFSASLAQERLIRDWCLIHLGQQLEVTCCKDFGMIELWDDRAIRVEANTGRILCEGF